MFLNVFQDLQHPPCNFAQYSRLLRILEARYNASIDDPTTDRIRITFPFFLDPSVQRFNGKATLRTIGNLAPLWFRQEHTGGFMATYKLGPQSRLMLLNNSLLAPGCTST